MSIEKPIIYHNPSCSKSRESLKILQASNRQPEIIEYLKNPPSSSELKRIISMLGLSARQLLRSTEPAYRELKLDDPSLDDTQIIELICTNPTLLQRPIVILGNKAIIGRPPSNILELF